MLSAGLIPQIRAGRVKISAKLELRTELIVLRQSQVSLRGFFLLYSNNTNIRFPFKR